ncbi:MAG: hypothetical protein ACRCX2_34770 [Paraclostridium sp.]
MHGRNMRAILDWTSKIRSVLPNSATEILAPLDDVEDLVLAIIFEDKKIDLASEALGSRLVKACNAGLPASLSKDDKTMICIGVMGIAFHLMNREDK